MTVTQYTTKTGDTIFSIAAQAYGDALLYQRIIDQNPTLPITTSYPAGIVVIIPILEGENVTTEDTLPPWKR